MFTTILYNKNMKSTGIICEYNPFHNGHIHHIKEAKKLTNPDILICIMSGNFVQRGEPSIINKWERAKVAVENGCDIVFELPFIYCTQSANHFAKGAIDCLKLADVNEIVFGSECNNINELKKFADINSSMYTEFIKEGISCNKAYEQIYGNLSPNDILGINYLKQIKGSDIIAHTIQRTNNYHEENFNINFSSATSIRNAVKNNEDYTEETPLRNLSTTFSLENYYPLIKALLLTMSPTSLSQLFLMDEGMENNLIKNVKTASSYEDFIDACVSKRYTRSRIQRALIHLMMHTTKETVNHLDEINYLRVLAYNETGKLYLKELRKKEVYIASKFKQIPQTYREMEMKATSIYAYPLANEKQQELIQTELNKPIFIRKK